MNKRAECNVPGVLRDDKVHYPTHQTPLSLLILHSNYFERTGWALIPQSAAANGTKREVFGERNLSVVSELGRRIGYDVWVEEWAEHMDDLHVCG